MLPEAFLERMKRQLGDEYESYLDSLNRSRAVALRFNPLKGEIPQLPFVGQPVPWEPMGYYYDYYITETQLDGITQHLKANALVKAVLLNESQIDEFSDLVAPISDSELEMLDYDAYKQDCATNANHAVLKFEQTKSGFVAKSDYDSDKLVFFSVPYDGGFSASIDGVAAPFEKVDNGLIAMRVPCGEHQIEFTYHTPGLKEGIAISITGLIVWILYALVCYNKGKKKGKSELQEVNKSPAALE